MSLVKTAKDLIQGKAEIDERRSPKWPEVRKDHLSKSSKCVACGGDYKLEVHHVIPFNMNPDLELDSNNLLTLCESKKYGVNCHLFFGHLGNYKNYNPNSIQDSLEWYSKISGTWNQ
jgi:hypothetical protein